MTERLSQLLHDEADRLDVPPVAADAVLARGRGLRRRRTASPRSARPPPSLAVVGGHRARGQNGDDDDRAGSSRPTPPPTNGLAWLRIRLDGLLGDRTAPVPGTIHTFHYTPTACWSAATPTTAPPTAPAPSRSRWCARTGPRSTSARSRRASGRPQTRTSRSTSWPRPDDGFVAVVRDAGTGETVDEVPLPDEPPSYWDVTPLALDGGTIYVGYKSETAAVDIATGESHIVEGMSGGIPDVLGGRIIAAEGTTISVLRRGTGELIRAFEVGDDAWGTLSPDGRYLGVSTIRRRDLRVPVHCLRRRHRRTGRPRPARQRSRGGWTAAGDAFAVAKGTLTTCDLDTGDCTTSDVPIKGNTFVKLGGKTDES